MHIQSHSQGRRWEASSAVFKNRKKCLDFGKKGPDCAHHWVKSSIQNVVLRVSGRKKSKMFICGTSFSYVSDKIFVEALSSTLPLPTASPPFIKALFFFAKRSILNVYLLTVSVNQTHSK